MAKRFCYLVMLALVSGCLSRSSDSWTSAKIANVLDTVPSGTAKLAILGTYLPEQVFDQSNKMDHGIFGWLRMNPLEFPGLKLYRQKPAGVLLHLSDDDLWCPVGLTDRKYSYAKMVVFFDSENRYKGYFTFSTDVEDDPARWESEKKAFVTSGCLDAYPKAKAAVKEIFRGGELWREKLPKLPLVATDNSTAP